MPMPASTTGIIHIEMLCTPAKSNAVLSIGIMVPPITTHWFGKLSLNTLLPVPRLVSTGAVIVPKLFKVAISAKDVTIKTPSKGLCLTFCFALRWLQGVFSELLLQVSFSPFLYHISESTLCFSWKDLFESVGVKMQFLDHRDEWQTSFSEPVNSWGNVEHVRVLNTKVSAR